MNCNSFQQLTKGTKEKIYRNDSSVKDLKFHRKIGVFIPDIRSHVLYFIWVFKVFMRKIAGVLL